MASPMSKSGVPSSPGGMTEDSDMMPTLIDVTKQLPSELDLSKSADASKFETGQSSEGAAAPVSFPSPDGDDESEDVEDRGDEDESPPPSQHFNMQDRRGTRKRGAVSQSHLKQVALIDGGENSDEEDDSGDLYEVKQKKTCRDFLPKLNCGNPFEECKPQPDRMSIVSGISRATQYGDDSDLQEIRKGLKEITLTKRDLFEWLHTQKWWVNARWAIPFTLLLWCAFLAVVMLHAQITQSYSMRSAIVESIEQLTARSDLDVIPSQINQDSKSYMTCQCVCAAQHNVMEIPQTYNWVGDLDAVAYKIGPFASTDETTAADEGRRLHLLDTMNKNAFGNGESTGRKFHQKRRAQSVALEEQDEIVYTLQFQDIISRSDIWMWIQRGLLPVLWETALERKQERGDDAIWLASLRGVNAIIGGVRLQQTRSVQEQCNINDDLIRFYDMPCHPANKETMEAYGPAVDMDVPGFVTRGPDSHIYERLLDVGRPLLDAEEIIEYELKRYHWIDEHTIKFSIQMAMFNAEARAYGLLTISFDFARGGVLTKEVNVNTVGADPYPSLFSFLPDFIFLGLVGFLLIEETRELYGHCAQGQVVAAYMKSFWNLLDWFSIVMGIVLGLVWFVVVTNTMSISSKLGNLTPTPALTDADGNNTPQAVILAYQENWGSIVDSIQFSTELQNFYRMGQFWYTLILMLRFFKAFEGQPRLAQIATAIIKAWTDVVHFVCIFVVVFLNFAAGGYVLFGSHMHGFSTLTMSISTSFRALMGDFDFAAMYAIAPVSATIWFWLYMIMVSLVLMNMLLAIMIDHYANVKQNVGSSITLFKQVGLEIKKIGGPTGLFFLFMAVPKKIISTFLGATGWVADKTENLTNKSKSGGSAGNPKAGEGGENGGDDEGGETSQSYPDDSERDMEAGTAHEPTEKKCCGKFSEKIHAAKDVVDDSFLIKKTSDYHYNDEMCEEMWERLGYEIEPNEKLLELISTNSLKIKWKMEELREGPGAIPKSHTETIDLETLQNDYKVHETRGADMRKFVKECEEHTSDVHDRCKSLETNMDTMMHAMSSRIGDLTNQLSKTHDMLRSMYPEGDVEPAKKKPAQDRRRSTAHLKATSKTNNVKEFLHKSQKLEKANKGAEKKKQMMALDNK